MRPYCFLMLFFWLLSGLVAEAGATVEEEATAVSSEATEEVPEGWLLPGARAGLRGSAYWLVANVDGWFGDKPFSNGGRLEGALQARGLYREDDGYSTDLRYKLRVRMPNLSQRAYLFAGRDNEQELIRDEAEAFRRRQQLEPEDRRQDQTFFAGLGYFLREDLDLRLGVRSLHQPYTQARYRKAWWFGEKSNLGFRQTLFLAVDDGLGGTTSLDYARALSKRVALRWRNSATVSTEIAGLSWSTSLGLFQAFGRQRELSLEALAGGETGTPVAVRRYGLRSTWSQPLHRDWLLGELSVGHFWPRDAGHLKRQRSWAVGLGLELLF